MRIRMRTSVTHIDANGDDHRFAEGKTVNVDERTARKWIAQGIAEDPDPPKGGDA